MKIALNIGAAIAATAGVLTRRGRRGHVVIDGENVMHWGGEAPSLDLVAKVARLIEAQGQRPCVVFGQLPMGMRDGWALSQALGLAPSQILLAPPGISPDLAILKTSRRLTARIVTNDRFRDFEKTYPEVRLSGFLRTGGLNDGQLVLN